MAPTTAALIVLCVLVLLLVAAGAGLLRRVRELELAVYRGVGLRFAGTGAEQQSLSITTPGRVTVVAKVTRQCPVCAQVLAAMVDAAQSMDGALDFVVLSDDQKLPVQATDRLRVITDPTTWRAVDVPFVPALLVVDEQGIVVNTTPAGSGEAVTDLVRRTRALGTVEAS